MKLFIFALLFVSVSLSAEVPSTIQPTDTVILPGFPPLGKWMIDHTGEIAHWLAYEHRGKKIAEPINVIIRVDRKSPEEAQQALIDAAQSAGFAPRKGHSSGYQAILGDGLISQLPDTPGFAFSNITYILPNNHGRIFGPLAYDGKYYFTAAFSREGVDWLGKIFLHHGLHVYDSFMQARNQFVKKMCEEAGAVNSGTVNLENALPPDDPRDTGDHDGTATVLDLN
jgi:hypothetical protein